MVDPTPHSAPEQKDTRVLQTGQHIHRLDAESAAPSDHGSLSDIKGKLPPEGAALQTIDSNAEPEYPPMGKVVVIMAALYMSVFLVALVRSIPLSILSDYPH